jgi:hypothetical protein
VTFGWLRGLIIAILDRCLRISISIDITELVNLLVRTVTGVLVVTLETMIDLSAGIRGDLIVTSSSQG